MPTPLLAEVIGAVANAKKKEATTPILATEAELRTQLAANPKQFIESYISSRLEPAYLGIPTAAVKGASSSAATSWNTDDKIRKVLADKASIPFDEPVANHLPKASVFAWERKLARVQFLKLNKDGKAVAERAPDETRHGFDTLLAYRCAV